MSSRLSSVPLPASAKDATVNAVTFDELEHAAKILEDLLASAKTENERSLCREVIRCYRAAASRLHRRAWSSDDGQDNAE